MDLFTFMSDSPFLSFFLAYVLANLLHSMVHKLVRALNILKHGYPPAHCDGDGDFKNDE